MSEDQQVTHRRPREPEKPRQHSVVPSESLNEAMWRDIAEITKKDIARQFDMVLKDNLQGMVTRAMECNKLITESGSSVESNSVHWITEKTQDKRLRKGKDLPEKEFIHRESVLTDLLRISHIRAIYHMFAAILLLIAAETILSDYLDKGSFRKKYHVEMCCWVFGQLSNTVAIWLFMQLSTLCVYPVFLFWVTKRTYAADKTTPLDYLMLFFYSIYQLFFMVFFGWLVFKLEMPPGSSILLGMELSRFMMKSHAFVRSNISKAFHYTRLEETRKDSVCPHENLDSTLSDTETHEKLREMLKTIDSTAKMSSGSICPTFSHYVYFLFAPTLVYRDSYPRTNGVRWDFVFSNALQFVLCVFYTYFILFRFVMSKFESLGERPLTPSEVGRLILSCMLPGGMLKYLAFFAFLHSWSNMFAELLRFGDRLFYKDWWNSRSWATYYRTWNVLVHDWLYTYIYLDIYKMTKSRILSTTMVFVISAFMHEYILCMTFKFFFPVLWILFGGAGFVLMFFKTRNRFWNLSLFANLCLGLGIEIALYGNEWHVRKNCASLYPNNFWLDFVVPRSLFCKKNELKQSLFCLLFGYLCPLSKFLTNLIEFV